jgi:hypothetical protein
LAGVLRERQKPGPALRTLAWDADTAPDIAGYRLYCGTSSGVYTQTIEVGNTTATLVSNLTEGKTHFFTVTAYEYCCSRKCAVKRSVVCRAHCHTKPLSDTDSNPDPDANTDSDPHNYAFGLADDGYHRGECDLHSYGFERRPVHCYNGKLLNERESPPGNKLPFERNLWTSYDSSRCDFGQRYPQGASNELDQNSQKRGKGDHDPSIRNRLQSVIE